MISETTSQGNSIPKREADYTGSAASKVETLQEGRQQPAVDRQGLPSITEKKQPLTSEELGAVVVRLNDFIQNAQRELQFTIDEESGRRVVKVIDSLSDEVIRQIPSEEILEVARQLEQDDRGSLVKEMA